MFPSNRHGAEPIAVHLYRVAIIDNLQYRVCVVELYCRQVRGNRTGDVDRRLFTAGFAL